MRLIKLIKIHSFISVLFFHGSSQKFFFISSRAGVFPYICMVCIWSNLNILRSFNCIFSALRVIEYVAILTLRADNLDAITNLLLICIFGSTMTHLSMVIWCTSRSCSDCSQAHLIVKLAKLKAFTFIVPFWVLLVNSIFYTIFLALGIPSLLLRR